MDLSIPLLETDLPYPRRQGKVRDVYDLGNDLLIISSDRISAFDWILPTPIPSKGILLTQLSKFWFDHLSVEHHFVSDQLPESIPVSHEERSRLEGRVMLTRKAQVIPFECVVRGYLEGSGWTEYQQSGQVCGVALPPGLRQCDRLPEPIFTPATKAESGHDENVTFDYMASKLGSELAQLLRDRSLEVYRQASQWASPRGIIVADTKFEWGFYNGRVILIDEVLTPDSSRFWPADKYAPGHSQPSFDKQFVREWLMQCGWDRNSPPPALPQNIVDATRQKYWDVYSQITGDTLE
ncbi:MAG: phosphoribosylaminoimidazolesuccinocarboxamide synthase [Planctomycetales bacterium]|nr:phosphoribosylaminoimidazolesuccinocarboxamide synthase [Planctomycetales bacterium]